MTDTTGDVLTPVLGLTKPGFDGPADIREMSTNMDILDAAFGSLAAASAVVNVLTNPGLETWQRGTGAYTTTNAWTADRWQMVVGAGSALSVAQDAANVDLGSRYALVAAYTHTAASRVEQPLEDVYGLRGRTLTFTVRVRAAVPLAARPFVRNSATGYVYGADHTGSGVYETLTVTAAVPATATTLAVGVELRASGTVQLDNTVLVVGTSAPPFSPLHPSEEWDRCLRYYQEIGGLLDYNFIGSGFVVATTSAQVIVRFVTEMAGTPVVTVVSPTLFEVGNAAGTGVACTALVVSSPSLTTRRECRLVATVAAGLVAGNATYLRGTTSAAKIVFESNPT